MVDAQGNAAYPPGYRHRKSLGKLSGTTMNNAAFLFITALTLGAMIGLVWWAIAPGGGIRRDELKKSQSWLTVDIIFCGLSVIAGVLLMVIFIRNMRREHLQKALVVQTIVLTVGAALGACVAALLGGFLAHAGSPVTLLDAQGEQYEIWFGLRSYASLAIYPLTTALLCFAYFLRQISVGGVADDFEE